MIPDFNVRADYKTQIMMELATNQDIIDILIPNPDPNLDISDQLLGYHDINDIWHEGVIFPYLYVAKTISEAKTFICLDVTIRPSAKSATMNDMYLYMDIFTNKALMKYEKSGYSGTRMDILMTIINRLLVTPNKFGIGQFIPQEPKPIYPAEDYFGYQLTYIVPDFKVKKS